MSGSYGNNSPGINQVPTAFFHNTNVSQHGIEITNTETGNTTIAQPGTTIPEGHTAKGVYFQPGGVIQNSTDDVYNRLIEFENINQFGQVQRFQLIGTTRSDPALL